MGAVVVAAGCQGSADDAALGSAGESDSDSSSAGADTAADPPPQEDPCAQCRQHTPFIEGCCCPCERDRCLPDVDDSGNRTDTLANCSESGCFERVDCEVGAECLFAGAGRGRVCSEALQTCEEIATAYEVHAPGDTRCHADHPEGCIVRRGHCEIGLGQCWYATGSRHADTTVDLLVGLWVAAGCETTGCVCPLEPEAFCDLEGPSGGKCRL